MLKMQSSPIRASKPAILAPRKTEGRGRNSVGAIPVSSRIEGPNTQSGHLGSWNSDFSGLNSSLSDTEGPTRSLHGVSSSDGEISKRGSVVHRGDWDLRLGRPGRTPKKDLMKGLGVRGKMGLRRIDEERGREVIGNRGGFPRR